MIQVKDETRIVVPSKLLYGIALGDFLRTICKRIEPLTSDSKFSHHVVTAFYEAFNNIVLHAYQGKEEGQIELHLLVQKDQIEISLLDTGKPYIPKESHGQPDKLPEGGMGIFVIHAFMNEVHYSREGNQNKLCMKKNFQMN